MFVESGKSIHKMSKPTHISHTSTVIYGRNGQRVAISAGDEINIADVPLNMRGFLQLSPLQEGYVSQEKEKTPPARGEDGDTQESGVKKAVGAVKDGAKKIFDSAKRKLSGGGEDAPHDTSE